MDTNKQSNSNNWHQHEIASEQPLPVRKQSTTAERASVAVVDPPLTPMVNEEHSRAESFWMQWYDALKQVFPIYLATHLAFFVVTCLSVLFTLKDFSWQALPPYTLWHSWDLWDSTIFTTIAKYGYTNFNQMAFFPLYSLLERGLMYLTHINPFLAGLIISNLAGLGIFVVLYRLVREDFNAEQAGRAVLYLALFPTAFYLASGYNESLFIFLAVLNFYQLRRGHWWWAGFFGFLASLTRSVGILLLIPFYYEYLRQHEFQLKAFRWNALAGALIPCGLALFSAWCYHQYHDPLAFSHAQAAWNRYLAFPGYGIILSIQNIQTSRGLLSFQALRNMTDLVPDLFILLFIILSFVGPWRLPRQLWVYGIYAFVLYIFLQLFPNGGTGLFPLESVGRFMLEVFPAFIVMAAAGKSKTFHMSYLMISGAILFFLLTQFLTGHWVL
jgi:Gpi18-like mannosyltransferase